MSFFCFFFSRPFHENFIFLKRCPYDFHEILHSHSTPKGAPACAKASKSYDWNVKNIAKISPRMAKISPKTAIFRLFSIFSKTVQTIRTKFLYSHSTPYYGPLCAISINSYGWDVRNIAKITQKCQKTAIFRLFFSIFLNCPYDSNENFYSHFLHHNMVLYVQFQ